MQGDEGSEAPGLEERVEGVEERLEAVETDMANLGIMLASIKDDLVDIKENHLSGLPAMARDIAWIKPLLFLILAAIVAGAVTVIATN